MHDAETRSRRPVDRYGPQRNIGSGSYMLLQQVQVIHPVKLVAAQDEEIIVRTIQEVAQILAHRVRRALVPPGVLQGLLCGEYLNKAFAEVVELVTGVNVLVQRDTVELRQHINLAETTVQTIADWNVDKAVFAAQWHGGFSALLGQRKEPGPGASTHNDGEGLSSEGFWIHAQYLGMAQAKCKEIWFPEYR